MEMIVVEIMMDKTGEVDRHKTLNALPTFTLRHHPNNMHRS